MRGDLEAVAWRRYRDLHVRVQAIEGWISSFGISSSTPSEPSIADRISKAGKMIAAIHGIVRLVIAALPFIAAGLAILWGWVKAWLLAVLH